MKKRKITGVFLVALLFLLNSTTVLAASSKSNDVFSVKEVESSYLINPWTKEKVYYQTSSEDEVMYSRTTQEKAEPTLDKTFYDEDAIEILNSIKSDEQKARLKQLIQKPVEDTFAPEFQTKGLHSKAWYRTEFTAVAIAFNAAGWPKASGALAHSLQDNPDTREYLAGSAYSNSFSTTTSYTEFSILIAEKIDQAHAANKTIVSGSGSHSTSSSNAGLDWYLTLGKYNYLWGAEKNSNGTWSVYIRVSDLYDFDKVAVPSSFDLIAIVSNHAADAQTAGAIVPYFNILYNQHLSYKPS